MVIGLALLGGATVSAQTAQEPRQAAVEFVQEFLDELRQISADSSAEFFSKLDVFAKGGFNDDAAFEPIYREFLKSLRARSVGSITNWETGGAHDFLKWTFYVFAGQFSEEEVDFRMRLLEQPESGATSSAWVRMDLFGSDSGPGSVHYQEIVPSASGWLLRGPPLHGGW